MKKKGFVATLLMVFAASMLLSACGGGQRQQDNYVLDAADGRRRCLYGRNRQGVQCDES
ncbi:hypothetical protein VQ056_01065 [Paenibacillus sp. JTLBN-2024]